LRSALPTGAGGGDALLAGRTARRVEFEQAGPGLFVWCIRRKAELGGADVPGVGDADVLAEGSERPGRGLVGDGPV